MSPAKTPPEILDIDGHEVRVTSPDRVVFPEPGLTKLDLVRYYLAVADGAVCFITSANLTGHAMERNMEAGVLLTGGQVPKLLHEHLQALVDTKTVSPV